VHSAIVSGHFAIDLGLGGYDHDPCLRSLQVYKGDGMLAGYMNITWNRKRYLLYAILKSTLCKCGCNGRCTMDAIQIAINASVNCCSVGRFPALRFDNQPWGPSDHHRASVANQLMGKFGVVTEYRADWPEMAQLGGFKQWNARHPCAKCLCTQLDMFDNISACCVTGLAWPERKVDEYFEEMGDRVVTVVLHTEADRLLLLSKLRFHKAYPWGRSIFRGREEFALKGGDKLVPTPPHIPDLHAVDTCELPANVCFSDLHSTAPSLVFR
jgi:hypothetical protein